MKEWYYRLNIQKAIEDGMGDTELGLLFGFCTDYITKSNISTDGGSLYKYTQIPASTLDNLKVSIAGKINNNCPLFASYNANNRVYPTYVYGDYYSRIIGLSGSLGGTPDIEEIKQMLDPYITEISKEEYEALIEWPITILGKE